MSVRESGVLCRRGGGAGLARTIAVVLVGALPACGGPVDLAAEGSSLIGTTNLPTGQRCTAGSNCASGVCTAGYCRAPNCFDGVKNGSETGLDCGGSCATRCADSIGCAIANDCRSGVCGPDGTCASPTCCDGVKNGAETDLDCGGPGCLPCHDGQACRTTADCRTGAQGSDDGCWDSRTGLAPGYCRQPSVCTNHAFNPQAGETDVDCGGPCKPCGDGKACLLPIDCGSRYCDGTGHCAAPPAGFSLCGAGCLDTYHASAGGLQCEPYWFPSNLDAQGNTYFSDTDAYAVRRITAAGLVSTLYGNAAGTIPAACLFTTGPLINNGLQRDDGLATAGRGCQPRSAVLDRLGNLFFHEQANNDTLMIAESPFDLFGFVASPGELYTVGGVGGLNSASGSFGFSGDGGPAVAGKYFAPNGIAVDATGNIYVADIDNCKIRMINADGGEHFGIQMTRGYIYTVAGNDTCVTAGTAGYVGDGGPALAASLNFPLGVGVDPQGNVAIGESYGNLIRFVPARSGNWFGIPMIKGNVYTLAGGTTSNITGASLVGYMDNDDIISVYPPNAGYTGDGGPSVNARVSSPRFMSFDRFGNLYFADINNNAIRRIDTRGTITTVAGQGGPWLTLVNGPCSVGGVPATGAMPAMFCEWLGGKSTAIAYRQLSGIAPDALPSVTLQSAQAIIVSAQSSEVLHAQLNGQLPYLAALSLPAGSTATVPAGTVLTPPGGAPGTLPAATAVTLPAGTTLGETAPVMVPLGTVLTYLDGAQFTLAAAQRSIQSQLNLPDGTTYLLPAQSRVNLNNRVTVVQSAFTLPAGTVIALQPGVDIAPAARWNVTTAAWTTAATTLIAAVTVSLPSGGTMHAFSRLTDSGIPATQAILNQPAAPSLDAMGNLYFNSNSDRYRFMVPAVDGYYFGSTTLMKAGLIYPLVGLGVNFTPDGSAAYNAGM